MIEVHQRARVLTFTDRRRSAARRIACATSQRISLNLARLVGRLARCLHVNAFRRVRSTIQPDAAILLIEPSPDEARTILQVMRRGGIAHRVRHVVSIEAARHCLFHAPAGAIGPARVPKLIFVDASLPDTELQDFLSQVRETPALCDTPLVLLTCGPDGHAPQGAVRFRADACLSKPFQLGALTDVVLRLSRYRTMAPSQASTTKECDE